MTRQGRLPRGTVERFVERYVFFWEGTLALLTVLYVVLAFGGEELALKVPQWLLLALAGVFLAEFLLRLWNHEHRWWYVRRHWVDGVTAIPLLGPLRALRLLRLLRLGAALRVLSLADRATAKGSRDRTSLWFLGPLLVVIWLGSSYAMWVLEHGTNPQIKVFADAMYLSFVMTTTLGYGNAHPTTPGGQVLAGVLIFFGIGLVGFVSAQITARLLHQSDPNELVHTEIKNLGIEIGHLRDLLEGHRDDGGVEAERAKSDPGEAD